MIAACLAACLVLPGRPIGLEPPVGHPKTFVVLASLRMVTAALDAWSTHRALARHPDAREANSLLRPFAGHPASLYGLMAGLAVLQVWIADRRYHRGESWQWVLIAGSTASGVAAGINMRF